MYKVDKNVPMPANAYRRYNGELPLGKLEIGDSFLIECKADKQNRVIHSVRVRLGRFTKRDPQYKFISRKVENGVRVWRKSVS